MGHTHGQLWTNELITESIMGVVNTLQINHMPTRVEIREFYGNDALTNRISKTFGYYGWAKRLGLQIKSNDTLKGKISERLAADILRDHGYEVLQMSQNYPYDLLIDKVVKADVKYSNLYHGLSGNFYSFALRKKYPTGGSDGKVIAVRGYVRSKHKSAEPIRQVDGQMRW